MNPKQSAQPQLNGSKVETQPGAAPKPFVQKRAEQEEPEAYDQRRDSKGEAVDSAEGEENKSPLHPVDRNKSPEDWQQNAPPDQPDVVEDKKEHDAVEE